MWKGRRHHFSDGGGELAVSYAGREADQVEGAVPRVFPWQATSAARRAVNAQRAAARARAVVRRIIRESGYDHLGTLTFPGRGLHGYAGYDRSAELVAGWMHHGGGLRLLGGGYVMVPELHPNGHGWHWHFAVRGWVDGQRLRQSWTAWLRSQGAAEGATAGGVRVNVRYLPTDRAARYLGKYLSKTFEDGDVPLGRHRYRAGQGVKRPASSVVRVVTTDHQSLLELEQQVALLLGDRASGAGLWVAPDFLVLRWEWGPGRGSPRGRPG